MYFLFRDACITYFCIVERDILHRGEKLFLNVLCYSNYNESQPKFELCLPKFATFSTQSNTTHMPGGAILGNLQKNVSSLDWEGTPTGEMSSCV